MDKKTLRKKEANTEKGRSDNRENFLEKIKGMTDHLEIYNEIQKLILQHRDFFSDIPNDLVFHATDWDDGKITDSEFVEEIQGEVDYLLNLGGSNG